MLIHEPMDGHQPSMHSIETIKLHEHSGGSLAPGLDATSKIIDSLDGGMSI